jgi:hypothetical protein
LFYIYIKHGQFIFKLNNTCPCFMHKLKTVVHALYIC